MGLRANVVSCGLLLVVKYQWKLSLLVSSAETSPGNSHSASAFADYHRRGSRLSLHPAIIVSLEGITLFDDEKVRQSIYRQQNGYLLTRFVLLPMSTAQLCTSSKSSQHKQSVPI